MLKSFPYVTWFFSVGMLMTMVVVILCLMPLGQSNPSFIIGLDKFQHFLTYLVLSFYFCQVIKKQFFLHMVSLLLILGVVVEVLQSFTGYRFFDLWDIAANSLGVIIGCYLGGKNDDKFQKYCCRSEEKSGA